MSLLSNPFAVSRIFLTPSLSQFLGINRNFEKHQWLGTRLLATEKELRENCWLILTDWVIVNWQMRNFCNFKSSVSYLGLQAVRDSCKNIIKADIRILGIYIKYSKYTDKITQHNKFPFETDYVRENVNCSLLTHVRTRITVAWIIKFSQFELTTLVKCRRLCTNIFLQLGPLLAMRNGNASQNDSRKSTFFSRYVQRALRRRKQIIHLYVELWFLVKDLPLVPLAAQVIDAVLDVVVALVVVLSRVGRSRVDVVQSDVIGTALVLVLRQICVREKRRRQVLKTGIVGVDDAATTRRQVSFLRPVGPLGRRQFVGRVFVRGVTPCGISRSLHIARIPNTHLIIASSVTARHRLTHHRRWCPDTRAAAISLESSR